MVKKIFLKYIFIQKNKKKTKKLCIDFIHYTEINFLSKGEDTLWNILSDYLMKCVFHDSFIV